MGRTKGSVGVAAGLCLFAASGAQAQGQSGRAFLDVNVGVQAPSQTLNSNATFQLFGETASVISAQTIAVAPVIDARIGYRTSDRFAVAVAVSGRKDESDGQAVASVPSPILFGSPTVTTLNASGLTRREIGYHFQLVWFLSVWRKVEVSVYGGPSVIHLRQAMSGATATGQSVTVASANETGNAFGGNGGIDATYMANDRVGVGFFAQYAGGSANLPSSSGVKVGGFQGGGGIRVRF